MLDFIPAHRSSTDGIVAGLKQALRDVAHDSEQAQPQPSTSQLTLQVTALHNAFLALSDAFTESLGKEVEGWSSGVAEVHVPIQLLDGMWQYPGLRAMAGLLHLCFPIPHRRAHPEVSRRKELQWEARLEATQQRFRTEVAALEALRSDYHQLASKNADLHKENSWLQTRVEGLEQSLGRYTMC